MDGTQMPMNMAAFASPLKYSISEKTSERKAAINRSLSAIVNFLNITILIFKFSMILVCNECVTKKYGFCLMLFCKEMRLN